MTRAIRVVESVDAPKPVGPYSQAVESDGLLFLSGQIGLDHRTGQLVSDEVGAQAEAVLGNISAVLKAAGLSLEDVVKVGVYLRNIDDFPKVNEVYGKFFTRWKPARTTIGGVDIPKGALVEMDAVARVRRPPPQARTM